MKTIKTIKNLIQKHKSSLARQYSVKAVGVFGSYARGNQRECSDIDILVEFTKTPDFFKFLRLEKFLKRMLGVKVDLVTPKALKPVLKDMIMKETIFL